MPFVTRVIPATAGTLLLLPLSNCRAESTPVAATQVTPDSSAIRYVGRFDRTNTDRAAFSYPGSSVAVNVEAKSLAVALEETGPAGYANYYGVYVDGALTQVLQTSGAKRNYTVADGLAAGSHEIELRKRTEGFDGYSIFYGFTAPEGGSFGPAPKHLTRRIEFIGDSITCGYGVGHVSDPPKQTFSLENENFHVSFAAVASEALQAESIAIAWSGHGMYRGYDGNLTGQLPELHQRVIGSRPEPRWDFANWTPDAVVINLGTNDYAIGGLDDAAFFGAYNAFIDRLREHYPRARIVCCMGPMFTAQWPVENGAARLRTGLAALVEERHHKGDSAISFLEFDPQTPPLAEAGHPSPATHKAMAAKLVARLGVAEEWKL